ncbi:hypothetical protein [Aquibium microcysteis]|uniref:hypothetical protein n=1 Tax=Aquibium microcysteis TaxID=675281 RepID=UPI003084411D
MVSLAAAVILAVADATRSIAASELVLTPLGTSWFAVSPETLNLAQAVIQRYVLAGLWDPVIVSVLNLPGFVAFLAMALLFYAIGRRPQHRSGRVRA